MHVYPLLIGKLDAHENTLFRGGKSDMVVPFFSYCFLVIDADGKYLVDTGFGDVGYAQSSAATKVTTDGTDSIETALKEKGVSPDEIEKIILTHCHWDHVGGLPLFSGAEIYCQRSEISWVLLSPDWMAKQYPTAFAKYVIDARARLVLLDGDAVLGKNIALRKVGGHSPGSQLVVLRGERREAIITGDAVFYYDNVHNNIPIGSYVNLRESVDTVSMLRDEIKRNPRMIILPGHDPLVWERYGREGIEL